MTRYCASLVLLLLLFGSWHVNACSDYLEDDTGSITTNLNTRYCFERDYPMVILYEVSGLSRPPRASSPYPTSGGWDYSMRSETTVNSETQHYWYLPPKEYSIEVWPGRRDEVTLTWSILKADEIYFDPIPASYAFTEEEDDQWLPTLLSESTHYVEVSSTFADGPSTYESDYFSVPFWSSGAMVVEKVEGNARYWLDAPNGYSYRLHEDRTAILLDASASSGSHAKRARIRLENRSSYPGPWKVRVYWVNACGLAKFSHFGGTLGCPDASGLTPTVNYAARGEAFRHVVRFDIENASLGAARLSFHNSTFPWMITLYEVGNWTPVGSAGHGGGDWLTKSLGVGEYVAVVKDASGWGGGSGDLRIRQSQSYSEEEQPVITDDTPAWCLDSGIPPLEMQEGGVGVSADFYSPTDLDAFLVRGLVPGQSYRIGSLGSPIRAVLRDPYQSGDPPWVEIEELGYPGYYLEDNPYGEEICIVLSRSGSPGTRDYSLYIEEAGSSNESVSATLLGNDTGSGRQLAQRVCSVPLTALDGAGDCADAAMAYYGRRKLNVDYSLRGRIARDMLEHGSPTAEGIRAAVLVSVEYWGKRRKFGEVAATVSAVPTAIGTLGRAMAPEELDIWVSAVECVVAAYAAAPIVAYSGGAATSVALGALASCADPVGRVLDFALQYPVNYWSAIEARYELEAALIWHDITDTYLRLGRSWLAVNDHYGLSPNATLGDLVQDRYVNADYDGIVFGPFDGLRVSGIEKAITSYIAGLEADLGYD